MKRMRNIAISMSGLLLSPLPRRHIGDINESLEERHALIQCLSLSGKRGRVDMERSDGGIITFSCLQSGPLEGKLQCAQERSRGCRAEKGEEGKRESGGKGRGGRAST